MSVLNLKKRTVSFAIVATLTLLYAAGLAAQGVQAGGAGFVAGRVTDKMTGEPLPGVFVLFQGYTYGAMTDDNGYYSLKRPEKGGILEFSCLGYETKRVKINQHAKMDVALVEAKESLDDVIVTGYAPIRKEGFSGNTTKIKKDELIKVNPNNFISAIQTFDPSFRIKENISAGSNPNSVPDVTLRGQTSVSSLDASDISKQSLSGSANLPIFILDGFG